MKVLQNLVFVVVSVGFSEFICCAVSISLCIQSVFKGCFRLQCLKSEINGTDLSKKKKQRQRTQKISLKDLGLIQVADYMGIEQI